MQFLSPIGFLALAGLIVPLVIHLWNVKEQKTLKIGSIALLGETAQMNSKSLKITDWWLLILRCLLLIVIAFLLAQPYIQQKITTKTQGGWILIEKERFPAILKTYRKTIDSLLAKQYEIHDFNVGFEQLSLQDTANLLNNNLTRSLSHSALLHQLNVVVPAGTTVYLYANRRLQSFGETLPSTNYLLHWQRLDEKNFTTTWMTEFAGKKFEAKSNATATRYQVVNDVNLPTIAVGIYEDAKSTDRNYLKAALAAIASFTKRKIEINPTDQPYDIAFWLSTQPVSDAFKKTIKPDGRLFLYAKGKTISGRSPLVIGKESKAELYQRVNGTKELPQLWSDGFGGPILTSETVNGQAIFQFYSRFNPQWSNLVWNETFVKALLPIVINDEKTTDFGFEANANDQRNLSPTQNAYRQLYPVSAAGLLTKQQALSNCFWIAAMLIFIVERILSFRKKPKYVN